MIAMVVLEVKAGPQRKTTETNRNRARTTHLGHKSEMAIAVTLAHGACVLRIRELICLLGQRLLAVSLKQRTTAFVVIP